MPIPTLIIPITMIIVITFIFSGTFTYGIYIFYLSELGAVVVFSTLLSLFPAALIYGFHPSRLSPGEYFSEIGYERAVIEFEFIKKILFIEAPLLILTTIIVGFVGGYMGPLNTGYDLPVFFFSVMLVLSVLVAFLRIVTTSAKKEFRYFFAKSCCQIVTKKEEDFQRMKYLFLALDSYSKYLQRSIHFEINLKRIYVKFLYIDNDEKNAIMKSICDSLNGDRLGLARYLSTLYSTSEKEQIFVSEPMTVKLKIVGAFAATVIPIIIATIQLLMQLSRPNP